MQFFLRFLAWAFSLFVGSERAAGAKEERQKIEAEDAAHLKRQTEVLNRPVSNDDLRKSLKDGSF